MDSSVPHSVVDSLSSISTAAVPSSLQQPHEKRRELNFVDRIKVIKAHNCGKSTRQLATEFRCGKTHIIDILTQRETYLRQLQKKNRGNLQHFSFRKRRVRRAGNEETNRLVWEWYCAQKESGVYVTGPVLQKEARFIAQRLGNINFNASNGWLESFRRLHNIRYQKSKFRATGGRLKVDKKRDQTKEDSAFNTKSPPGDRILQDQQAGPPINDVVKSNKNNPLTIVRDSSPSPLLLLHAYSIVDECDEPFSHLNPHQRWKVESSTIIDSYWSFSAPENKIIPLNDDDHQTGSSPRAVHHPVALHNPTTSAVIHDGHQDVVRCNPQHQELRHSVLVSNNSAIAAAPFAAFSRLEQTEKPLPSLQQLEQVVTKYTVAGGQIITPQISGPFDSLTAMAHSRGLGSFEYSDDRGNSWMEIRPPPAATVQIPFYGYRTHLMRLIVDQHLHFWLEALGQCIYSGSFVLLPFAGSLDVGVVHAVLDMLAGGVSLCQGRDSVHSSSTSDETFLFTLPDCRYRSYNCSRLVEGRTGQTQCSACS